MEEGADSRARRALLALGRRCRQLQRTSLFQVPTDATYPGCWWLRGNSRRPPHGPLRCAYLSKTLVPKHSRLIPTPYRPLYLQATRTFLNGAQVLVEEKLDGANLGIRLNAEHCLVFQNRSHTVCSETGGLWKALTSWIARHGAEVTELLLSGAEGMACETAANTTIHTSPHHPERFILFGEWLPLVHSVKYDALPGQRRAVPGLGG